MKDDMDEVGTEENPESLHQPDDDGKSDEEDNAEDQTDPDMEENDHEMRDENDEN